MPYEFDGSPFDGLIFDCDGTLADTMPLHFDAWRKTMAAHGIRFDETRFYAMAGQPTVAIVTTLLTEQQLAGDSVAIAQEKEQAFLDLLPEVRAIEPVADIARRFHGSKPMGVGSGSNRSVVIRILEQLELTALFDAVVGAEDTARHKPEPDVFLEVARRIQVPANRCLVFEDADLGIQAARNAEMACFDIRAWHQPRRLTDG